MAATSLTIVSALLLLPLGIMGVAVVRREQSEPHGKLHQSRHHAEPAEKQHHGHHHSHAHKQQHHHSRTMMKLYDSVDSSGTLSVRSYCNYTFPAGPENTDTCDDATHTEILDEDMCIFAAALAGAGSDHASFNIKDWDSLHPTDERPQGCFKHSCTEHATGVCYFFNGDGAAPTGTISGTKVCKAPRWLQSLTPDVAAPTCPTVGSVVYTLVDDEFFCRAAATCDDLVAGTIFQVGIHNASKHLDYPRGCFVDKSDGKVYLNEASDMGDPTGSVTGTIMCNVSSDRDTHGASTAPAAGAAQASCTTFACPDGKALKADAPTISCAADPCTDADKDTCCE